jgi:hypothetical protein
VEATRHGGARAGGRDAVTAGLVVFGLYLVGISIFAAVAPTTFFEEVGRFGPRNEHYIHDVAAFQAAVGLLLLLAVRRSGWRVPALAVAAMQFGLHAVSHLVDMGDADPRWLGVFEFAALTLATAALLWLLARAHRASGRQ